MSDRPKTPRLYGLFRNVAGPGCRPKYERVHPDRSGTKGAMIRSCQDLLIASAFSGQPLELRPLTAKQAAETAPLAERSPYCQCPASVSSHLQQVGSRTYRLCDGCRKELAPEPEKPMTGLHIPETGTISVPREVVGKLQDAYAKFEEDFAEWMDQVDACIQDHVSVGRDDLPDQPYRRWFDEGKLATWAAGKVVAECMDRWGLDNRDVGSAASDSGVQTGRPFQPPY